MSVTTPPPLFTGKHITLRTVTPADISLYYRWLQNPIFLPYKPYLKHICPTPAHLLAYLNLQAQIEPRSEFEALVIHQKTQAAIGMIGLAGIDRFNKKAEFSAGFVHGHGTHALWEAIHAGIALSFATFNLHKLIFYTTATNHHALKIMQRHGFTQEGYFKEEVLVNDNERIDLYRFALMHKDWSQSSLCKRLNRIAPLKPAIASIENTLLSEEALKKDWNKTEEDNAWTHLQINTPHPLP
ncbi:MAG: hypothetical protein DRQ41_04735 [Gammaproteobacteria bacterium]|nr:MAG: hypothetical protein DRQ41_04735 [Gammaproteobacteria bacterium]RKZ75761.1 MAG: hypothetical protein DRQ57_06315 [Gammaproteobacteria bacterium]